MRELRRLVSVGSRELDRLAGLREGHVAMIEARRGDVESNTAINIARVFGVPVEWVSKGEGPSPDETQLRAAVEKARAARSAVVGASTSAGLP